MPGGLLHSYFRVLLWCALTAATAAEVFKPANRSELESAVSEWIEYGENATYGHISSWDTSEIDDMSDLFRCSPYSDSRDRCIAFNEDISNWNTSKVTNMYDMFSGAESFNQPLDKWDVSRVTNMEGMFSRAFSFNEPIGNWDVSRVTSMYGLFEDALSFNQPIGNWDVSRVTDMKNMFEEARSFNQPIGNWDVSRVTTMEDMFKYAHNFNQPIGNWNVSQVTRMQDMFEEALRFNQSIGSWDVSKVTRMDYMFDGANCFSQDITPWSDAPDYSAAEESLREEDALCLQAGDVFKPRTSAELREAVSLWLLDRGHALVEYGNISDWETSEVDDMSSLFADEWDFNDDISNWNTSNVTNMERLFDTARNFNQPIGNWDVSRVTNMAEMLSNAYSFNQPIGEWDVSQVTNMRDMFKDMKIFNQPIGEWDVSRVTTMEGMFENAESFSQPIGNWDVSKVTTMRDMFADATSFNQPIGNWDVSKVTNMFDMFYSAESFNYPIGNWNVSQVTNMGSMFDGATCFNQSITAWSSAPDYSDAVSSLPEEVEVCPEATEAPTTAPTEAPTEAPTSAPTEEAATPAPTEEGFYWITDVCGKALLEPRIQSQHSYAAVRCCDLAGESAMTPRPCQIETFHKADEICTELGMTICNSSNVYLACGTGCNHNHRLVWTKSSGAPESATTENIVLEGDFDSVVGSKQGVFLDECSASLSPVRCVTVEAGSILVTLGSEDRTALEQALDNIGTSGLSLPSFRHLYKVADDEASAATNPAVLFPLTFLAAMAAAIVG